MAKYRIKRVAWHDRMCDVQRKWCGIWWNVYMAYNVESAEKYIKVVQNPIVKEYS